MSDAPLWRRGQGPIWWSPPKPIVAGRPVGGKARRIFERDGFKCAVVGCTDSNLTMDHIVSLAEGGSGDDENIQTLCRPHNELKGRLSQAEFLAVLALRGQGTPISQ